MLTVTVWGLGFGLLHSWLDLHRNVALLFSLKARHEAVVVREFQYVHDRFVGPEGYYE